jgi:hypothetical protein
MRKFAAFNLPCFNQLYHGCDEFDLDFNELYLRFAKEEDPFIVKAIAASIHEAFRITTDTEDSQKLRDAFKYLIEMNNRDIIPVLIENLDVSLLKYCNEHAVKTYAPVMGGLKEEAPKEDQQFPLKKYLTMKSEKKNQKKITTFNLDKDDEV